MIPTSLEGVEQEAQEAIKMSDETTTTETESTESTENDRDTSALPKWARSSLTTANNEAAKYRTELRDKTEEHTAALAQNEKLSGQVSKAESERDSAQSELKKLRTVLEMNVPGGQALSLASRLQGSTDEELKADAESLVKQFGLDQQAQRVPAYDPSQGRGGDTSNQQKPNTPENAFAQVLGDQLKNLGR